MANWKGREKKKEFKELRRLYKTRDFYQDEGSKVEKVPIKPEFFGMLVTLKLKHWASERFDGLDEAAEKGVERLIFSENDFRKCNLKKYISHFNVPENEQWDTAILRFFDKKKYYKKGHLDFTSISEDDYKKFSDKAKEWVCKEIYGIGWDGKPLIRYKLNPKKVCLSMFKEVKLKLFVTSRVILNNDALHHASEIENHIVGKYGGDEIFYSRVKGQSQNNFWNDWKTKRYVRRSLKQKEKAKLSVEVAKEIDGIE